MTRRAFALPPTRTSPFGWKLTTLGRRRAPCSSARTCTFPARTHATTVLVVPRSMPTTLTREVLSSSAFPARIFEYARRDGEGRTSGQADLRNDRVAGVRTGDEGGLDGSAARGLLRPD